MNYLETYIKAQKQIGSIAFAFSAVMFALAACLHFFGYTAFSIGFRNGSAAIGTLLILMGIALQISQESILKRSDISYRKDKAAFTASEVMRMRKVKGNYPKGQTIMTILLISSIALSLNMNSEVWQGIFLSLSLFFVGNIGIEAFSYRSIKAYYQALEKEHA